MKKLIKTIQESLEQLPNMRKADISSTMSTIKYIASGGRDRYEARENLLKQFVQWGRDFTQVLRDEYKLSNKNTNYSSWEYGTRNFTIDVYYVFPQNCGSANDNITIKSVDDFVVSVSTYNGGYKHLGFAKTPAEAMKIVDDNNLRQLSV